MNNSENVETFEEQSYEPEEENNGDSKIWYQTRFWGADLLFQFFSKLGLDLFNILIKKRKFWKIQNYR